MVYFLSEFRGLLLLCTLSITLGDTEKFLAGGLPDIGIISSFLEQFIKPYMASIRDNKAKTRSKEESKVEEAIKLKISALKPWLEDVEVPDKKNETENNLTLKGNDETTIIEFLPKNRRTKGRAMFRANQQEQDPVQKNIKKYKILRQAIKDALDKEHVAGSTKTLITRTLDEMIAMLIERQCTWKSVDTTDLTNHIFKHPKNMRKSMKHLKKLSNKQWMSLRKQYSHFLRHTSEQEDAFIKQFHSFFSTVINNSWNLTQYKVRCQLVKLNDDGDTVSLRQENVKETNQCDNFRVCTDELKDFFMDFYKNLNDTSVSTFRNYASMYIRDVKEDIKIDKDIVVSALETISNTTEKKVIKIFSTELEDFKLDEKKSKKANIENINNFIKSTKDEVKIVLLQIVDHELTAMNTKLFTNIKDDLVVNLKADLDNMAELFKEKMCASFVMCNGKNGAGPIAARRVDNKSWVPRDVGDIYVKVQLSLDDELKDSLAAFRTKKRWQGRDISHRFLRNLGPKSDKIDELGQSNLSVSTASSSSSWLEMTSARILAHKYATTKTTIVKVTRTLTPKHTLIDPMRLMLHRGNL